MKTLLLCFLLAVNFSCYGQLNLQWQEIGPSNFGADVRALLIDKRDTSGNTLYAGCMGGGIWKSINGGGWWEYLGCLENFGVSCLAQAPNGVIYAGTGDMLLNYPPYYGNGIFVIDTLDIISHLDSTSALSYSGPWTCVNRIAVNPTNAQHLLAATTGGLFQTFDGGVHWSLAPLPAGTSGGAIDVKWSADSIVMAVAGYNKVLLRSKDYGLSWTRMTQVSHPGFPATQGRIEVAIAPFNSSVVYASIGTTSGATYGVYRTNNAGTSWDTVSRKNSLFNPCGANNECWADNGIAVLPYDSSKIITGGYAAYCISGQTTPTQLAPFLNAGLTSVSDLLIYGFICDAKHPEVIYAYGHRGVFKCTNAQSGFPNLVFTAKCDGIRARDFTGIAAAANGKIYGTSHFTGTLKYSPQTQSFEKITKFAAACEVSAIDPKYIFVEDWCGQLKTSVDSGQNFFYKADLNLDPLMQGDPSRCGNIFLANAPYIAPIKLLETSTAYNTVDSVLYTASSTFNAGDTIYVSSATAGKVFPYVTPVNLSAGDELMVPDAVQSRLLLSTGCGIWMKRHALDTAATNDWYMIADSLTANVSCFAFSSDGDVLYAGNSVGRVIKVKGLNRVRSTANWLNKDSVTLSIMQLPVFSANVEDIAVDRTNADRAIVVLRTYAESSEDSTIFLTSNGGGSWNLVQLGLKNNPVYACLIDAANSNNYIIGTENGVWSSTNGGQSFVRDNGAMCEVPVTALSQSNLLEDGCPVIYAATDARGLWRSFTLTPAGCDISLDVNQSKKNFGSGVEVFPNPADDFVNLRFNEGTISAITISDLRGNLLFSLSSPTSSTIDTRYLANGMYIATVTVNGKKAVARFIVTH
ncbi:MAG: T9SS type A sorting domain-containing protein [Chitinophagales bacterium]